MVGVMPPQAAQSAAVSKVVPSPLVLGQGVSLGGGPSPLGPAAPVTLGGASMDAQWVTPWPPAGA